MKWSIVGLLLLGLVAAFCVAMLVGGRGGEKVVVVEPTTAPAAVPARTQIVKAKREMLPMTLVDADSVQESEVLLTEAPEGYASGPASVIGKILSQPVTCGQIFTRKCFASENSGANLAAILPKGMRAISLTQTNNSGMEGLLYPGCMVDVLVLFKMPQPDSSGAEAMSKTLLQNIEVLAVDDRTIFSASPVPEKVDAAERDRRKVVTLMVNNSQAQALQLAKENGVISLTLRNPQDAAADVQGSTRLAALADDFFVKPQPKAVEPATRPAEETKPAPAVEKLPPTWEATVIRGGVVEKQSFPMPKQP